MSHRISIADARKNLAEVVQRSARGERIKLTRYNHSLAVLIPKRDLQELERCQEEGASAVRRSARRRRRSS
jgi:prevent-host-death family protein